MPWLMSPHGSPQTTLFGKTRLPGHILPVRLSPVWEQEHHQVPTTMWPLWSCFGERPSCEGCRALAHHLLSGAGASISPLISDQEELWGNLSGLMPLAPVGSPDLGSLGPKRGGCFRGGGWEIGRGCLACLRKEGGIPCLLLMKRLS